MVHIFLQKRKTGSHWLMLVPVNRLYINTFLIHLPKRTKKWDMSAESLSNIDCSRPHISQPVHSSHQPFHNKVYLSFCCKAANSKTNGWMSQVFCCTCKAGQQCKQFVKLNKLPHLMLAVHMKVQVMLRYRHCPRTVQFPGRSSKQISGRFLNYYGGHTFKAINKLSPWSSI